MIGDLAWCVPGGCRRGCPVVATGWPSVVTRLPVITIGDHYATESALMTLLPVPSS